MIPAKTSSARARAQLGGLFYLLMAVSGGLAAFARRGLIVRGDAAATAANIVAHPSAYLGGFAGEMLVVACYVAVVALFHRMLEPVNRTGALAAACFGLLGCAAQSIALIFYLAPLTILGGAPPLGSFDLQQLQALAFLFQKLYSQTYGIALVFFGFYCVLIGFLAFRSRFLPRAVGALMMLAGLGWLTFLAPPFAARYFPFVVMGSAGEGAFALWLLVKGVDEER